MANGAQPREMLDLLLKQLGEELGAGDLHTSPDGVFTMEFEDAFALNFLANPNDRQLIVWCMAGTVGSVEREVTLARLLRANLFWHDSGGATISMMPASDDVVLADRRPLEGMTLDDLHALIERMIEHAMMVADLLGGEDAVAEDSGTELPSPQPIDPQQFLRV